MTAPSAFICAWPRLRVQRPVFTVVLTLRVRNPHAEREAYDYGRAVNRTRRCALARASRDITVPIGRSICSAMSR